MICDDIRREMLDRDWDRATLGTASRVISHLDDCPACRQALEQYDTLRQLLHVAQEVPRSVGRDWAGRDWARAFPEVPKPAPRRLAWAMVMAASLVAGIAGWGMYLHDRTAADRPERLADKPSALPKDADRPGPSPLASGSAEQGAVPLTVSACGPSIEFTPEEVTRGVAVFNTVYETFGGRTSWVAIGGHSADMGLMPTAAETRRVILLRLVMSRNERRVSSTDLVVVPGQIATLDVPAESNQVLHYSITTTADADRRLVLWAEVREPGAANKTLAALATTLNPVPGQVVAAGHLATSSGSYNLDVPFSEQNFSEQTLSKATP